MCLFLCYCWEGVRFVGKCSLRYGIVELVFGFGFVIRRIKIGFFGFRVLGYLCVVGSCRRVENGVGVYRLNLVGVGVAG